MTDLPSLAYSRPGTIPEALAALRRPGACIYAGGTDLLVALQCREPASAWIRELVDIKDLEEARGIEPEGAGLRIGALESAASLASNAVVRRRAAALRDAARVTSAPLLRARGTIGGNVVTMHPGGDMTTALLALDASLELVGPRGGRQHTPLARFLARTGRPAPAALVVALRLPATLGSAYEKLAPRHAFARATVAVAIARHTHAVHVAYGGISTRPVVARIESGALDGSHLAEALLDALGVLRSIDATLCRAALALAQRAAERLT